MKYRQLVLLVCTIIASITINAQNFKLEDPEPYFNAIIVEDFDISLRWYSDVFDFETISKNISEERGFKVANLKRGNVALELIELKSSVDANSLISTSSGKTRIRGLFKFGFYVSDFDAWVTHFSKLEVSFHGRVVTDPVTNKKALIILDPDGNRIQIFEKKGP